MTFIQPTLEWNYSKRFVLGRPLVLFSLLKGVLPKRNGTKKCEGHKEPVARLAPRSPNLVRLLWFQKKTPTKTPLFQSNQNQLGMFY